MHENPNKTSEKKKTEPKKNTGKTLKKIYTKIIAIFRLCDT